MSIKIAIVGSRDFGLPSGRDLARRKVENFVIGIPSDWTIVSGGAAGPDSWAVETAKLYNYKYIEHLPRDDLYSYKIARLERNKDVVADADILICFWDGISTGSLHSFQLMIQSRKPARMVRLSDKCPTLDQLHEMLQLSPALSPL